MISTAKLVYDFYRKMDLVRNSQQVEIPLVDAIAYLNDFQQLLFNADVREAERNQEIANGLRRFKKDRVSLALEKQGDLVLAKYPADLHTRLNQTATVVEPTCCEGITKTIGGRFKVLQSDDINTAIENPLQRSSFYFERLISVVASEGLLIFPGEMQVKKVVIDYYRKPGELHNPSSERCGGSYYYVATGEIITEDTNCEFENYGDNLISDGAVLLATADKNNPEGFNIKLQKLIQSRNITSVRD